MVKIQCGNILDVTKGVIFHQVNCRKAIGAGLSGQIIQHYPIVAERYYDTFKNHEVEFGQLQYVTVADGLMVVNSFSQESYGNAAKTGKVYTDEDVLVRNIIFVCKNFLHSAEVYIPWKIGCGLAGGNWNKILVDIIDKSNDIDNLTIVKYIAG